MLLICGVYSFFTWIINQSIFEQHYLVMLLKYLIASSLVFGVLGISFVINKKWLWFFLVLYCCWTILDCLLINKNESTFVTTFTIIDNLIATCLLVFCIYFIAPHLLRVQNDCCERKQKSVILIWTVIPTFLIVICLIVVLIAFFKGLFIEDQPENIQTFVHIVYVSFKSQTAQIVYFFLIPISICLALNRYQLSSLISLCVYYLAPFILASPAIIILFVLLKKIPIVWCLYFILFIGHFYFIYWLFNRKTIITSKPKQ